MAGFNSDAVAAMLKQGFEAKAPVYKPEAKTQTKAESAWGAKGKQSSIFPDVIKF